MPSQNNDFIRLIRESRGYSQEFMASRLYVTQQAYSRMEKQPENMTLKRLRDVADILELDFLYLLEEMNVSIYPKRKEKIGYSSANIIENSQTYTDENTELITSLQNEVKFLRSLLKKLSER